MVSRMLTLEDVADALAINKSQVPASVRRNNFLAGKVGGRGQWLVDRADLRPTSSTWTETSTWIDEHPFTDDEPPAEDP